MENETIVKVYKTPIYTRKACMKYHEKMKNDIEYLTRRRLCSKLYYEKIKNEKKIKMKEI